MTSSFTALCSLSYVEDFISYKICCRKDATPLKSPAKYYYQTDVGIQNNCLEPPTGGLVTGIAIGALSSAVYFTLSYARVHVSSPAIGPSLSGAVRTAGERDAMKSFAPRMAVVSLSGYIMFGSAVHVRDRVLQVCHEIRSPLNCINFAPLVRVPRQIYFLNSKC